MIMKKIVLGIMALTLAFSSMAQTEKKSAEGKELRKRNHFKGRNNFDNLNLTDNQKVKIKSLNDRYREQNKALNQLGSITVDEQRARRQQLAKEHREKVFAILTPEQRKQAETTKGNFEGRRDDGAGKMEKLTKDLNLTPEQLSKVSALNKTFKSNLQSIRQNTTLSGNDRREQVKNLAKKHRSELESLLTSEQREQLKNRAKNKQPREAVK